MALLFELANCSLNLLQTVPEEISCTSKNRSWGIPSENIHNKDPVMNLPVKHKGDYTLYDPRLKKSRVEIRERTQQLQQGPARASKGLCKKKTSTKYGNFIVGSTLSHQLLPLELHFSVVSNLEEEDTGRSTVHSQVNLLMTFIDLGSKLWIHHL